MGAYRNNWPHISVRTDASNKKTAKSANEAKTKIQHEN